MENQVIGGRRLGGGPVSLRLRSGASYIEPWVLIVESPRV
jgi:hypothetical protein